MTLYFAMSFSQEKATIKMNKSLTILEGRDKFCEKLNSLLEKYEVKPLNIYCKEGMLTVIFETYFFVLKSDEKSFCAELDILLKEFKAT